MKVQNAMSCFGALLFAMAVSSGDLGWMVIVGLFFFFWLVLAWYWRGSRKTVEIENDRMLARMQEPGVREAMQKAFDTPPGDSHG